MRREKAGGGMRDWETLSSLLNLQKTLPLNEISNKEFFSIFLLPTRSDENYLGLA